LQQVSVHCLDNPETLRKPYDVERARQGDQDLWNTIVVVTTLRVPADDILDPALTTPAIADLLTDAIQTLPPHEWPVASAFAAIARSWWQRRAVGRTVLPTQP
jgi:hypothetical protein